MPLISVVIPVFNSEKTIYETVQSVLNQTFKNIEVIVINDGSQDASLNIIESIKDNRLRIFSYSNAGLSASRNRGINLAKGEYISFIDADDLWVPDKLEAQLVALQTNSQAAVAYSWTDYIDENGQFLYSGSHITLSGNVYKNLLLNNFLESGSNVLVRKQVFEELGYFDESLTAAEDWDMWLRLAQHYSFVAVASSQVLYRLTTNSMSGNIYRQESECLKVLAKAFEQAPESLQVLKKSSVASLYSYLTFKVLVGSLSRQKGLIAARFLWQLGKNDVSIYWKRSRLMSIVIAKVIISLIFPDQQAQALMSVLKRYKQNYKHG